MWNWINETLLKFKHCFWNKQTFVWFVILIIGLMTRSEQLGITSIVRELSLNPTAYNALLHFFRAESWYIETVKRAWIHILKALPYIMKEAGRYILTGDGVKQSKEGRKMPGVAKQHQESENSSKGEYIFGHLFGGLGLLVGNAAKQYSVLISAKLHDGIEMIEKWEQGEDYEKESHVVKMVKDAISAAEELGSSILLLDRLYLTKYMLQTLQGQELIHVVTKAKLNAKAYYDPKPKTGKGPKPKKGESLKVADLFTSKASEFISVTMNLYQKDKAVKYYCVDLRWGSGIYQKLRFVLTVVDGVKSILVSTDLTLTPVQIIRLYCYRFKIECSFRELKQVVAGFAYHFWSKAMPKLNRYKSNDDNQAIVEKVTDPHQQALITSTVNAIEGFVQFSCIALGLLQLIGLMFSDEINSKFRFMRTTSNSIPSEATIADFLRKNFYMLFRFFPHLAITAIINSRQLSPDVLQKAV